MAFNRKKHSLPSPSSSNFNDKVKEIIEVREGVRGGQPPAFISYSDLSNIDFTPYLKGVDRNRGPLVPTGGTPPKPPTNLSIISGMLGNALSWDVSVSPDVWYYEIWVSNSQDRGSAERKGTVPHPLSNYTHHLDASNVTSNHYYWIRAVNWAGLYSVWEPSDAQGGYYIPGQTSYQEMVREILDVLEGQVREGQLYSDLQDRIDLIDAPVVGLVDVVNNEIEVRSTQVNQLWTVVGDPDDPGSDSLYTSVQTHAESIDGIQGKYTVKIDNNGAVSGYGLISEDNDGEIVSEFGVVADSFWVGKPGADNIIPFIIGEVEGVSTVGINGQLVVDGSIYAHSIGADQINATHIAANEINAVHIAANAIDAGHIVAGSITAEELDVNTLSAITADLGTITAGKAQNSNGTNFIDFSASGANSFLKVGNNVDIKADGTGIFAREVITPPKVVASGSVGVVSTAGINMDHAGDPWSWTGSGNYRYRSSILIRTNLDGPAWTQLENRTFAPKVAVAGAYAYSGANNRHNYYFLDAELIEGNRIHAGSPGAITVYCYGPNDATPGFYTLQNKNEYFILVHLRHWVTTGGAFYIMKLNWAINEV